MVGTRNQGLVVRADHKHHRVRSQILRVVKPPEESLPVLGNPVHALSPGDNLCPPSCRDELRLQGEGQVGQVRVLGQVLEKGPMQDGGW